MHTNQHSTPTAHPVDALGGGHDPGPTPTVSDRSPASPRQVSSHRLTVAAGWSLITICVLHTIVFSLHPWWAAWLAGPFRSDEPPLESVVQFWGLPGGFVIPGVLLAAMIIGRGRRGHTAPGYVAPVLGIWAALCIWMVGPSGFLFLAVPVTLLIIARARSRRSTPVDPVALP